MSPDLSQNPKPRVWSIGCEMEVVIKDRCERKKDLRCIRTDVRRSDRLRSRALREGVQKRLHKKKK